jgi:glycosyltransferase involved in cell wall biosynthesis
MVHLTPGAGNMYCGACLRDNALVSALRAMGHPVVMAPMYLPMRLDETDESAGAPVFFSGINVYLAQKSRLYRKAPQWVRRVMASRALLQRVSKMADGTRAEDLGELTVSMLRGEEGRQRRELDDLIGWLRVEKPEVVCLSNVLLAGMARRIRAETGAAVVCSLQGEDYFLDRLPEPHRQAAWQVASERAADVDLFIAPSHYFGRLMGERLKIAAARVKIVPNGIRLEGYEAERTADGKGEPPMLGFFARMCIEKGLDHLVQAYVRLKKRSGLGNLKLRIGGSCGPSDEPVVAEMRDMLTAHHMLEDVEFWPNLSHEDKQEFLRSLTVFSVPARHPEAFGLYVVEAMAAGAPVVQPDHGAFPELLADTGGGRLFDALDEEDLADSIEAYLRAPEQARAAGAAGRAAVVARYSVETMAAEFARYCREAAERFHS